MADDNGSALDSARPPDDRLESWKEIAAYLRRGVRTVRRWEKEEGLPIHRQAHKKQGTVYAHRSELDSWRGTRDILPAEAGTSPRAASRRLMIAVLPFVRVDAAADTEYLAEGLTEEMIGQLGRGNPESLGVIARTTMMQYGRSGKTAGQIGGELQVDYIVEGSLRKEGSRVRVTARLIQTSDQAHVWSGNYEQAVESILVLERDLARDIAHEIRLTLLPRDDAASGAPLTVNVEAYHAHLKGRHFLNGFSPESVRKSVECFRRAIQADPAYAPAHASLAEAYQQLPVWTDEPPANAFALALEAAEQAVRLDPRLPEAYSSLGLINACYLWKWQDAERHFVRALELNPSCSAARQWYAEFLAEMGRIDDALRIVDRALMVDPLSRAIQATRAFVLLLGRRFDDAIAQAESVLELDPVYPMALIRLGIGYAGIGRYDEAAEAFERAAKAAPQLVDCVALLGYAYGKAGRPEKTHQLLEQVQELSRSRYVPAFLRVALHLGLGDHDEAIRALEREYQARGWYLLLIKQGHQFDPLRSDARFQALVRAMNFPA